MEGGLGSGHGFIEVTIGGGDGLEWSSAGLG
jgi:hypothetical protein